MRKFPWRRNKVRMFPDGPRRLTLIEPATFWDAARWAWSPGPQYTTKEK
jgi:hypothetical protein